MRTASLAAILILTACNATSPFAFDAELDATTDGVVQTAADAAARDTTVHDGNVADVHRVDVDTNGDGSTPYDPAACLRQCRASADYCDGRCVSGQDYTCNNLWLGLSSDFCRDACDPYAGSVRASCTQRCDRLPAMYRETCMVFVQPHASCAVARANCRVSCLQQYRDNLNAQGGCVVECLDGFESCVRGLSRDTSCQQTCSALRQSCGDRCHSQ